MSAILNPTPQPTPSGQPAKLSPALPPEAPSGKRWKSFLVLALVAGAVWAGYEFGYKPREAQKAQSVEVVIPTTNVQRGTLQKRTRIAGTTAAKNFATITAPMIRGPEGNRPMVLLNMVNSGAQVKQGDVIARIDGQSLQDHIDDVKDTVEAAIADVRKRKAELEIDWKNLEQTILVAKADLDKARLEASAAEVRTEVERQLLQLSFEEAQARYKQLQSAVWGGSSMRTVEQGDQVTPGQPFMKVVNPASMMLDARINQAESDDFRLGQTAEVRLDAFPGMVMKAKVFSIGAIAAGGWRQSPYIRTIPLKLAIEGSDSHLIPDLSGSADVVLDQVQTALIVPRQSIYRQDGKAFVDVKTADGFAAREVTIGLSNDTHATILGGLQEGQQIRLNH